jgi:molecular chaperone GrpE
MLPDEERQGPVIRDRRRIDPATGQVRDSGVPGPQRGPGPAGGQPRPGRHSVSQPGMGGASGAGPGGAAGRAQPGRPEPDEPEASQPGGHDSEAASRAQVLLAERTADLQRLQAEYANYRKRVERDRLAVREQALANVLNELLPVLDDIGRAREHGELTGGFKSVADSLEGVMTKLGLTSFGENGDPFDPTLHEALMHSYSADVTEPTAVQILQPGYKVGERIIRPARVSVAEPMQDGADAEPAAGAEPAEGGGGGQAESAAESGAGGNGDQKHDQPGAGDVPPGRPDGAGS